MLTKAEKAAWIMKREAGHQKIKDHIRTDRRAGNVGELHRIICQTHRHQ